jgi:hypothetical protein
MQRTNGAWHLTARPRGGNYAECLEWREEPVRPLGAGEVLVRNQVLSLDPANRIWMNEGDSYMPAVPLGEVMRGVALGVVEESAVPELPAGSMVQGLLGWQRFAVMQASSLRPLPPLPLPLSAHFGLLGHIGMTAYFGVVEVGEAKAGETMVVNAAAGAVGSLACQVGKNLGLRVVGIAGGETKCRWLVEELGVDAAIDYRRGDLAAELRRHCPDGVDVSFENVGGEVMDAVFGVLRQNARVALCGMISQYNALEPMRLRNFGRILMQRAAVRGFIVTDFQERFAEGYQRMVGWHLAGRMKYRLDEAPGLEQAPEALGRLFAGANEGKLVVRV